MKSLLVSAVAALGVSFTPVFAAPPEPPPLSAALVKANLDRIPATDPAVTNPPQLVDAMKGTHPRLLFTTAEIAALKAAIATDPVLQRAYDGNRQWANISLVPSGPRPLIVSNDTSALVKSYSQAPSMAYAYALDHDPAMKKKIVDTLTEMLNLPFWDDGEELDSNMGCACNMMMVSLLYDTVYHDLDPDLRAKLAANIFLHARHMYYLGHKYWQQDPQPNHRWYRDMGLAACVLVTCDEKNIDAGYLLQALKDEMDFVIKWYPPDGDCHEGTGYQDFGYTAIATACEMMDRNLGTDYLQKSGLKNAWAQQLYYWVPGRKSDISWGDDQNSISTYVDHNAFSFFLGPHLSKDKTAQAALLMKVNKLAPSDGPKPAILPWTMLAFYDPTVGQADYKTLQLYRLFPDIGAASMRDSWDDDAVVFTFKCGPYGGYKLNEYRNTTLQDGKPHAVNVAHDDPDANEFAMAVGNGFAFHPGVYTESTDPKVVKLSQEHSTITVDDKGQVGEGFGFSQPVEFEDMTQFSYLTGWKTDDKGHVIIEGEAGPAYRGQTGPDLKKANNKLADPVLKTYRRTAIWMPKEYVLLLDNIVANGAHKITWRGTAPKSEVADGKGTVTTETGTPVAFQTVADKSFDSSANDMILKGRFGDVPVQQLQYTLSTDAVKFATVLDPWKTNPVVKMTESGGVATVEVTGSGYDDTWTWNEAKDATTPSVIDGKRAGAPLVSLTEADKAPRE
jgi:hypothetical protein